MGLARVCTVQRAIEMSCMVSLKAFSHSEPQPGSVLVTWCSPSSVTVPSKLFILLSYSPVSIAFELKDRKDSVVVDTFARTIQ